MTLEIVFKSGTKHFFKDCILKYDPVLDVFKVFRCKCKCFDRYLKHPKLSVVFSSCCLRSFAYVD